MSFVAAAAMIRAVMSLLSTLEKIPFASAAILVAKTVLDSRLRQPAPPLTDPRIHLWRDGMMRDGVHVVEQFLTAARCAELRAEVDRLMTAYPSAVQVDAEGADHRLFLGAAPPGHLAEIFAHPELGQVAAAVLGGGVINIATLAGRITSVPGNRGSGGGWHRDSFTNQFKAIIYLNDVDVRGGPFQFIRGSHQLGAMIHDRRVGALTVSQSRIRDQQIAALVDEHPERLLTLTGAAGTLILADTTGLHRGMPIVSGTRHALTNYYYPPRVVSAWTYDHFKPILGRHIPY